MAKMMYRKDTGEILGVHMIGLHSADNIHEFSNAMNMGQTLGDLKFNVHAHPTVAEVRGGCAAQGWQLKGTAMLLPWQKACCCAGAVLAEPARLWALLGAAGERGADQARAAGQDRGRQARSSLQAARGGLSAPHPSPPPPLVLGIE